MSSVIGLILNDLAAALVVAANPDRTVTRTLKDFAARDDAALKDGVFSVISRGQPAVDAHNEAIDVLIVGQGLVDENAAGEVLEEFELLMAEEVRELADNLSGTIANITRIQQSQQLEAPYLWVAVEMTLSPFDLRDATGAEPPGSFISYTP